MLLCAPLLLHCGGTQPELELAKGGVRKDPGAGSSAAVAPAPRAAPAAAPAIASAGLGEAKVDTLRGPLAPGLRGFCMHGGAPLVGRPLVDTLGRLYLVTQDGYLHAYEADGRFRFSFTVTGTPLGSPSLRASDNAVLLGTTARAVYGIAADGQLSFKAHTVTPVWSGLHARDAASVVYVGLDRYLYALSNHGAALYRVALPGQPVGEPVVAHNGLVWVPLDTGLARMEQARSVRRFPTPAPVDELALSARGPFVLTAGSLWSFQPSGSATDHGRAGTLLADGTSVLALDGRGGGLWFPGGDPARAVALGPYEALEPSGEGGLLHGRALLPLDTGEVALLDVTNPAATSLRRSPILSESLALAAFTPGGARILVTSRSGRACLLDDPFTAPRRLGTSR